jgi:hypothetical protein
MRRTDFLALNLPDDDDPLVTRLPFAPALSARTAQMWHFGKVEGVQWYPDTFPRQFAKLVSVLAFPVGHSEPPEPPSDPRQCGEITEAYYGKLFDLLSSFRAAGLNPDTWRSDPLNSERVRCLDAARSQILPQTFTVTVDTVPMAFSIKAFLAGRESLMEAGVTLAYRAFDQLLEKASQLGSCPHCTGIFRPTLRNPR